MARDLLTCRTFLAASLTDGFSAAVSLLLQTMKPKVDGIKWVDPAHIHATLHFFGPTAPEELVTIADCVSRVTQASSPFEIGLGEVGYFPGPSTPRVIWVGLTGAIVELQALREKIEDKLRNAGFGCETRPFHPHVTLGRIGTGRKVSIPKDWEKTGALSVTGKITQKIDRIILYRSDLTPSGPHYENLKTFLLSEKPRS